MRVSRVREVHGQFHLGRTIMGRALLLLLMTLVQVGTVFATDKTPVLPDAVSQTTRNRAIAGRVFEEIFNQGKFQVADEIYAKDFVNRGLHRNFDLQEDQAAVRAEKKAFPDLRMSVILMVAEGDLVTVVWVLRGTHTGAGYDGLPPTGVKLELRGITVWRIVDGKISEEWTSFDELQAARQFVTQLRWPLAGLFFAAVILVWALCRVILRLGRMQAAKATS
jgi:steroid delta-isomerase-like uncharacterized protein